MKTMTESKDNVTSVKKPNPFNTLVDCDRNTILHYSAAHGKHEDFKKEVIGNQSVDVKNYLGWTPLMMACRNGQKSTIKNLLNLGADASKCNKFGMSVFLICVSKGDLEIVTLILEHLLTNGISRRILQRDISPLSLAILFKHKKILEYLINQQFDVNATIPEIGITPLMVASAMGYNEDFNILIQNKADQSIKNLLGNTAKDIRKSKQTQKNQGEKDPNKLTPAEIISKSPHMSPQIIFSPCPSFINPTLQVPSMHAPSPLTTVPPMLYVRKSSNCEATTFVLASDLSPFTPIGYHAPQVFFPTNFTAGVSPVQYSTVFGNTNELLNVRLTSGQTEMFLSPLP